VDHAQIYDTQPGDVYWAASDVAGSSGIPTSCTDRCSRATTVLYEASQSAPRTPAHSGVSHPNTGEGGVHRANRDSRDQEGRTEGLHLGKYDLSALKYLFQAGERLDPAPTAGVGTHWASCRRPLVADRDRLVDRREPDGRSNAADQARLRDGAMPGL